MRKSLIVLLIIVIESVLAVYALDSATILTGAKEENCSEVFYISKDQAWKLESITHTTDYTIIHCLIEIKSNHAGCFEAHEFVPSAAKIYISGVFGIHPLIKATYSGAYKPSMESGFPEWNYYEHFQKGKVAHADYYFARVPACVEEFSWSFYGGIANEKHECDDYECPTFKVANIYNNNPEVARMTRWTEAAIKQHFDSVTLKPIEGVYQFRNTSNIHFWGTAQHKLGIVKEEDHYLIVYIDGANPYVWKEGLLKGKMYPTATRGVYRVEEWRMENKMISYVDFFIAYREGGMMLYDSKHTCETLFMKTYPYVDMD